MDIAEIWRVRVKCDPRENEGRRRARMSGVITSNQPKQHASVVPDH